MFSNIFATIIHTILASVLVFHYDMGIHGVGIASSIQFLIRFIVSYILLKKDPSFN